MLAVLAIHVLVAVLVAAGASRLGPRVFWVAALAPAATVGWVLTNGGDVLDGDIVTERREWVSALHLDLAVRVDAFALTMLGIVGGIGVLVMVYASQYFERQDGLGRFSSLLVVFTGAMTGLVVADDLVLVFVFWELTSVTSYGLIGFKDSSPSARAAATQALLVTGAGGLALLAGLVLLTVDTGAASLSELAAVEVSGSTASWAAVLILVGCFTKSAQVPFHGWLPGAMAAPTPVSAYLHSATMVKAGVFLVARLSPALAELAPWRPLTMGVGLATMCWGGYRSLRQTDLKLLLAYGTVSQLGMLVAVFGAGEPKLLFAGTALLVAHAVFKASLFMVVGIVDHSTHTREIRRLSGVGRALPVVLATAVIGGASMAGVIPLLGFLAKEAALLGLLEAHIAGVDVATTVFVAASGLTAAYTLRLLWEGFRTRPEFTTEIHRPGVLFVAPAALLAIPTVVLGIGAGWANELVGPAAAALDVDAGAYELHLWPGFTTAFGLSLLALALGGALFAARDRVERLQLRLARPFDATDVFGAVLQRTLNEAARLTGLVQSGSLPLYLSVIIAATVVIPSVVLVTSLRVPDDIVLAESPIQAIAVGATMAAATGIAITRRRFSAVLLLGVVGFGAASLFVVQGAPDLALTQVLVEIVSVSVYVLVLRHLPEHFRTQPFTAVAIGRVAVSALVGAFIFGATLTAAADRTAEPVDADLAALAAPEADGENVVNVTLVDFRGLDTVGESLVLVVAALGIMGLVRAGRTPPAIDDDAGSGSDPDAGPAVSPTGRGGNGGDRA